MNEFIFTHTRIVAFPFLSPGRPKHDAVHVKLSDNVVVAAVCVNNVDDEDEERYVRICDYIRGNVSNGSHDVIGRR